MTDKTYLQALTDARNAANQAKIDEADRSTIEGQKIKAAESLDKERWDKFRALLNEQAGEFNAVKDQTGVALRGQVRPDLQFGKPFACYDMRLEASAVKIQITFFQEKDDRSKVELKPENTRNISLIEACLVEKKIQCNAAAVKALFIELASVMVAI